MGDILLFFLGAILFSFGFSLLKHTLAYQRAVKRGVFGYKHGMVLKNGSLRATYTEVYLDPKTGRAFFGKTKIGFIDRF